ncbi:hypothetical protein [Endozoicomonas sp. ALD040]|uniref:hypothetical protein n=1 Tax=Endozoicomonas sp. ALD040 TaxID=3403079 RepID=UPI003BAE8704
MPERTPTAMSVLFLFHAILKALWGPQGVGVVAVGVEVGIACGWFGPMSIT